MNGQAQNHKSKKQLALQNKKALEQLGELATEAGNIALNEGKQISQEVINQLLGRNTVSETRSGNIEPGQSINVSAELAQKMEANKSLENQLGFEKRLFEEVRNESQKKLGDLRVRLQALMSEAAKMAATVSNLSETTKSSLTQAPVDPGEYHIAFIQNLIEYISTFRKTVDSAINWMAESNRRSQKKNYWSQYKKKGASFLLSNESFLARSAG